MSLHVGIIGFTPIRYLPFLRKYQSILDAYGIAYDIICFDREAETHSHDNVHIFSARCFNASRYRKALCFWRFRRFARKIVLDKCFDKLIVLTAPPAVLLSDLLLARYRGRFLLDYRDVSFEHFAPYRWMVRDLARASALTAISSPAFAKYVPSDTTVLSHNIKAQAFGSQDAVTQAPPFRERSRIVLTYMGHIGYHDVNRHLVERLAGAPDIELRIIGEGSEILRRKATYSHAKNVSFRGRFEPGEKEQFYLETDLVANTYGDDSEIVRLALSNKLYEAAWYRRPLIVSRNTLMQEYVDRYNLGFAIDPRAEDVAEAIRRYAMAFDVVRFYEGCKRFLAEVCRDEQEFESRVLEFCELHKGLVRGVSAPRGTAICEPSHTWSD